MDLKDIKEKFKQVIFQTQGIPNPKVDELFSKWLESKSSFIDIWPDLIYTYPKKVSFELDEKDQRDRVNEFIDSISMHWKNPQLADFVYEMKDNFYTNMTDKDFYCHGNVIKKGTKLIKSFKYFEKEPKTLEDIQNEASRLIQENKIEGYLHLSVHPLDYLSISENSHKWRSCHSLDGTYRSGNLSYMVDKSTIVCYLSSEKDEKISNFPFEWNSKKWRTLLFLSTDWSMIFAGRQYPFDAKKSLDFISEFLLAESGISNKESSKWGPWHTQAPLTAVFDKETSLFRFDNYIPVGNGMVNFFDLVKSFSEPNCESLNYNDLLYSSKSKAKFCYVFTSFRNKNDFTGISSLENTKFDIGGSVPCLRCAKNPIEDSFIMHCKSCEEEFGTINDNETYGYCACCGRHMRIDCETTFLNDDYPVCSECEKHEISYCDNCGEPFITTEGYDDNGVKLCSECKENLDLEEE